MDTSNIKKEKLLDNSDLYEIPEDRVDSINNSPENDRKEVTDQELDVAYKYCLECFSKWEKSICEEKPEGNKDFLTAIQNTVEEVDRALAFKYTDTMGIDRQMIFKPERLSKLSDSTLKNRLELQ